MSGTDPDQIAAYKLIETGTLVEFEVLESEAKPTVSGDSLVTRIELQLEEDDVEWGGLGFIFCIAVLSFHDARPRGASELDFVEGDQFTVADLVECLRYEHGQLRFAADYFRGRCVKTDVTVRQDGRVTLGTRNRGEAALRWIDRIKGKKMLKLV